MTFFYDLNKRMAELSQKQTLAEHAVSDPQPTKKSPMTQALNERDMGKHNNATTGFAALAKKAGKEYGSKAAGERVAGAQFQKMKKAGQLEEQGQLNELSPELLKRARDKAGEKWSAADDRKDKKASAKYNAQDDKFNSALRKKQKDMAEGDTSSPTKTTGGRANMPTSDVRSKYYPPAKPPVKKFAQPTTAFDRSKTGGLSTAYTPDQTSRPAGMNPDPASRYAMGEEGGIPMTAKQKSFAALAPPKDKITFADKIAGAKQEVEEMLGDVAAEAIKSALSPKQKKLDMNKNGKLDANDFAMLRKGGNKQVADEGALSRNDNDPVRAKLAKAIGKYFDKIYSYDDSGLDIMDSMCPTFNQLLPKYGNDLDKMGQKAPVAVLKRIAQELKACAEECDLSLEEGWDDMEKDVKRRMGARKVGDVTHGDKHDTQEIPGGRRVTRRVDPNTGYSVGADSDAPAGGEKRGRGRPKSSEGPRQERTTAKSRKVDRTAYSKKKTNEDDLEITDRGEYDQEGEMAKDSIKTVVRHAQALEKILGDNDNLPEWVQAKLAKIEGMMTAVDDYMQNQQDDEQSLDEKEITDEHWGMHAQLQKKKKDGIQSFAQRLRSDDDRAERAGKKVTKDIEYDEKKKEKKVDETTTSGSVATGGDAPKAGKGGMQIGKGIYDSLNRKVEGMIAESMSINVSMTNDDNGSHKNITVTAADEDAEALAQMLRSAGLGGDMSHGHAEPCPDCGSTDCGCDQGMAEAYGDTTATQNEPNWPTDTETSDDAMQYSGGLNGPKSTGQTTVPVIAHQGERTGVDDEELRRMMEMAGIDQSKLKPWERTMKEAAVKEGIAESDLRNVAGYYKETQDVKKLTNWLEKNAGLPRNSPLYFDDVDLVYGNKTIVPGALVNPKLTFNDLLTAVVQASKQGMAEGVVDTVKDVVKKGIDALKGPDDDKLLSKLEKETGGKRPEKKDEKMQESLMREFANFRI